MAKIAPLTRRVAPLALIAVLAIGLGACSHTTGGDFAKPVVSATDSPLDPGPPGAAAPAAAAAPANPVNVGTIDASGAQPVAAKPQKPAKVAAPATPAATEPAVLPAAFASEPKEDPGAPEKTPPPVAKTVRDDGFPNINAPPPEPSGKLLTPEERARVISELEALKNRQGVAPQKAPATKCTDEQVAARAKGCSAPAGN